MDCTSFFSIFFLFFSKYKKRNKWVKIKGWKKKKPKTDYTKKKKKTIAEGQFYAQWKRQKP